MSISPLNSYSHSKCFSLSLGPISLMIRPKVRKIENAPNEPKWHWMPQGQRYICWSTVHICWSTVHGSQISLLFALRSLVFQIIDVFGFPIGYNGEFQIFENIFVKNQKLKISNKNVQRSFVRTIWRKIQEECENFWLYVVGVTFWNLYSHWVPC